MMKFFETLFSSLRHRTLLALGTITLLTAGLAAATLFQISQIRPSSESILRDTALQAYASAITIQLSALDGDVERYILFKSPEYREKVQAELTDLAAVVSNLRADSDSDIEPVVAQMEALLPSLQENLASLLDEANPPSAGQINRLTLLIYTDLDNFKVEQQKLLQILVERIRQTSQSQTRTASRVQAQILFVAGFVLLVSIGVIITIGRSLRNVPALTEAALALFQGDLSRRALIQSKDELGLLANAFNRMADQLQELIGSLEQRVADRTKALQTALEISRSLSAATSLRQLAVETVEQLQSAFGYYHAHIYFFDESGENLVMTGGTGEAGAAMLAAGHSIPKGRGLVGRAAETNQPVLVTDVSKAIGWLPNPLLPDTQSELAVPIALGEQVVGVIDVQQNRVNALDENDVALLQTIAAQVAVSYQNARTAEQTRQQAEFETLVNLIAQQIQRADTVEETLQTAAQVLAQALGAPKATVSLQAPSEQADA
jgi:nitrate/nitrite-specific signal transduction histidine kinase